MQPDDWRTTLRAGRKAAVAAFTPDLLAQMRADNAARRAEREARRAAKLARASFVNQRLAHGDTPEELAASLGMGVNGVIALAQRDGHALMQRKGFRRLASWVSHRDVAALDALASESGVTREKMLGVVIADALASGAFVAKRRRRAA